MGLYSVEGLTLQKKLFFLMGWGRVIMYEIPQTSYVGSKQKVQLFKLDFLRINQNCFSI